MIGILEKFITNIKSYIETSNDKLIFNNKEELIIALNERNDYFRSLYNENKDIINKIKEGLNNNITKEEFIIFQEYANKLYTLNEQLDCAIASVIHQRLLEIARNWSDIDLIIQESYYLSAVYYTFDTRGFINKRLPLYLVTNEYKDKYFTLEKKTRELFLKLYGNHSMIFREKYESNEALTQILEFKKEYFSFLDRSDVRELDPDFKYDVFKFSVDSNIATYISELRYGKSFSEENFNELKNIIESQYLERLALCKETSKPIPSNYEQRYYTIQYFDGKITIVEWMKKIQALINRLIQDDEISVLTLNSVYFLETIYLTVIDKFSNISKAEFKQILNEVKTNCFNYLLKIKKDKNLVNAYHYYMTFTLGLKEIKADKEDIKNSFLNLVRVQSPETYVHIQSVSRISLLILEEIYKKKPKLLIGTLNTKTLDDVFHSYEKIKSTMYDGALLHDAGKCSCMLQIANYYRPLTDEEFDMIKKHSIQSYEFLYGFFDEPILEIALYHHLWHNHKGGYPQEQLIPINNQLLIDIVSIADSIDAGTDTIGRSYSTTKDLLSLIAELKKEQGTRYAKEVLDIFNDDLIKKISEVIYDFKYTVFSSIVDTSRIDNDIKLLTLEFKLDDYKQNLDLQLSNKKISDEFYNILIDYMNEPHSLDAIKDYVLSNVNDKDIITNILSFRRLATLLQDNLGIALSYVFEVWPIYTYDLARAIKINSRALTYLKKVFKYEKTEVYLSYMNNSIILANASGDLMKSYEIAMNAYELTTNTTNYRYLIAFSNNYIYVLNELGLYEKSYEIITNNMNRKEIFYTYNYLNNLFIYINVCIGIGYSQKAISSSKLLIKEIKRMPMITLNAGYSCLLESGIIAKNDKIIDEAFTKLNEYRLSNPEDELDIYLTYEAFAHYYLYIEDYQNALKYYKLFEPYIDVVLGNRKDRYQEQVNIYRLTNDLEKEHYFLEKLNQRLETINEVLKAIAIETKTDVANKLTDNTYRVLYENADKITNFSKAISSTFDLYKIKKLVSEQLLTYVDYVTLHLYFINENKIYMEIEESTLTEIDSSSDINKFIISKKDITIVSKDEVKDSIKERFISDNIQYLIIFPLYNNKQKIGYLSIGTNTLNSIYRNQSDINNMITYVAQALGNVQTYFKAVFNANIDYQTKVNNRAGLDNTLNKYFEKNITDYYIVMIDIDSFKSINDQYGHLCGDRIIEDLAKKLIKIFTSENVARMGGDEFVAIFFGEYDEIYKLLKELNETINQTIIEYENEYVSYTVSMGAIAYKGFDKFYKGYTLVDDLLYEAKRNGRNQFIIKK